MATITTVDGRELDIDSLVHDADCYWEQMGDALVLVAPSVDFEARRDAEGTARASAVNAESSEDPARFNSLEQMMGWWLGTLRRAWRRLQAFDLRNPPFSIDDPNAPYVAHDWLGGLFDDTQLIANALQQIDHHVRRLRPRASGDKARAADAFHAAFERAGLADLRDVIEHMADHVAGKAWENKRHLSPDFHKPPSITMELGWPARIDAFGQSYFVTPVFQAVVVLAKTWGDAFPWPEPPPEPSALPPEAHAVHDEGLRAGDI